MPSRHFPCRFPTTIAIRPSDAADIYASHYSDNALHDNDFVDTWVDDARKNTSLNTMLVPLDAVDGWRRDEQTGNICHQAGRFFCVTGFHCRHRVDRHEIEWDQPIIEQPETGILGILAQHINGILHFCLQAKEEPGNIGSIQLSPTVQATYSNYTGAHGGSTPLFLDHFLAPPRERIIYARMQSEDGGRFIYKANRNMIVHAGDDFPRELPNGFIWLTLRQIADLIRRDNLVNACARSILSSLVLAGHTPGNSATGGQDGILETLQWLDDRRAANHMQVRRIGLNELKEWEVDGKGFFSHLEQRFFRVVGLQVSSGTREIRSWGQPIIENTSPGVIGLMVRNGANGLELLMQAKAEAGNRNTVQLGPTVQFTQGNYEGSRKLKKPFLYDAFLKPGIYSQLHESRQSEEGARFYREYHLHRILMLPDGTELPLPPDYHWLPLSQVMFLLHLGQQVNSCSRSILSCLL